MHPLTASTDGTTDFLITAAFGLLLALATATVALGVLTALRSPRRPESDDDHIS
ncbi:hypothetical protein ACWEQL_32540 [Kitasatospora sp. NPDC004240]